MALQGEHDCGHGYRSWTWNLDRTNARVDAGFRAGGAVGAVENGAVIAIGYSQGALVAEALAAEYPSKYRRLILIGSPRPVNAQGLSALEGAALMAGTFDNRSRMKEDRDALERVGVPATFIEIPNARHGQLLEGERVMNEALTWLEQHAKRSDGAPVAPPDAQSTQDASVSEKP
jgi:pimeloyl-ACP methyl ester carboxylesterase